MSELTTRWRLALGRAAEAHGVGLDGDASEEARRMEEALDFVYGGEGPCDGGAQRGRGAGSGASQLTVPSWVEAVSELFPRQAKELLEREVIKRRGLAALLESPDVLDRIEPSVELVKVLITHKGLLNEKTRGLARKVIDKVVRELKERLEVRIEQAITGALRRDRHSPRKVMRNLDLKTTLRRNLKNWDEARQRLLVERLWYFAVFSAVMASIFAELPSVRTSLVLFDTNVVDLSDKVGEPVDVLLSVQLGGGTDITKALSYCAQLVREPARTIVVLITDFYEGRPESDLVRQVRLMSDAHIRMIGLGALGYDARPEYNRSTAGKLRKVGMDILACTPEKLAECMAQIISG
jgi:hypothetical protein